jgi:acetolactate synthase-1/2/3 large subunit
MSDPTCWRAIVDALNAEKIRYVFGIPSDGIHLYKDLADVPEIEPVLVRHETSAAMMSIGYSRISHEPAVCYASPGPGVANLVPGLLEAYSACSPIIALGSAVKIQNDQMGAFQENDQVGMMKLISKWAYRITRAEKTNWAMNRAFTIATNGRPGPVYIDVPKDVGFEEAGNNSYMKAITYSRVAQIGRAHV